MLLANLNIGQPALSYHMKILLESGIVESRQAGKWTHYRLSEQGGAHAKDLVRTFVTPKETQQESACCGR
jgi:ArsR family transcriptional regulator